MIVKYNCLRKYEAHIGQNHLLYVFASDLPDFVSNMGLIFLVGECVGKRIGAGGARLGVGLVVGGVMPGLVVGSPGAGGCLGGVVGTPGAGGAVSIATAGRVVGRGAVGLSVVGRRPSPRLG